MNARLLLLVLLALALVAAGCGSAAGGDGDGNADDAPGGTAASTSLEIAVWPQGEDESEPRRYTLTCDPPGGDHPDPEAACAALDELGAEAFEPVPADTACTQIFGGPAQAHVTGTVAGEQVDARLAQTDGCEISRWETLSEVVPGADAGPA